MYNSYCLALPYDGHDEVYDFCSCTSTAKSLSCMRVEEKQYGIEHPISGRNLEDVYRRRDVIQRTYAPT